MNILEEYNKEIAGRPVQIVVERTEDKVFPGLTKCRWCRKDIRGVK